MREEIIQLNEDVSQSPLYSEDLAPVPKSKRTWSTWSIAAIWIGMAVCIPTYLLASYMIKSGLGWVESLVIIGLANLIITIPMVLNGHAGVKYGIPFPVLGRASFGTKGIHLASIMRALVACGWFGIQTWIGGLAIDAIYQVISGGEPTLALTPMKFIGFGIFWLINMYFIWKGTERIKWLEEYSAPILLLIGLLLISWGASTAGGFGTVLKQSKQLQQPTITKINGSNDNLYQLAPLADKDDMFYKADEYATSTDKEFTHWQPIPKKAIASIEEGQKEIKFRMGEIESSEVAIPVVAQSQKKENKLWTYIKWLSIMLGFWATMSLSIADITRYAKSQRSQIAGQFIGLPLTMLLFSFVGIFVTCAAIINFQDILIGEDAPWDPVSLLAKFKNPWVVVISQVFMIIATLSTNIAANVIAPSNAFSNLWPKKISFRTGGIITGIIGILIMPWWLLNQISGLLLAVSGFLGPVVGILIADYFLVRKTKLKLADLFKENGAYTYSGGINWKAIAAFVIGLVLALIWTFIPSLNHLSDLAWFSGFFGGLISYWLLMLSSRHSD